MEAPFLEKIVAHPTTDPNVLGLRLTDEYGKDTFLAVSGKRLSELIISLCGISVHLPASGPDADLNDATPPALIAHHIEVDAGRFAGEAAVTIYAGGMRLQFLVSVRDLSAGLKSLDKGTGKNDRTNYFDRHLDLLNRLSAIGLRAHGVPRRAKCARGDQAPR